MTLVKTESVNAPSSATEFAPRPKASPMEQPHGKAIRVKRNGREITIWSFEASH